MASLPNGALETQALNLVPMVVEQTPRVASVLTIFIHDY